MNFSRKTILVVGAALLAACGDKVTVAEYTPPPVIPHVNSVEVSPLTATLSVGQAITLTAAVNADAGLATTVTWASSDASKASVSSAGVVTAVAATPGVAICATSTVDTGKKGCASIVVQAPVAPIPATVSINAITYTGNLGGTVTPSNVNGSIDVTLNVNPGNQTVTKVETWVGGKVACTQTFTAAQAAALRFAGDEAVAAQSTFPQIVCTVNTAAFDATTGVPTYLNGPQTVQAKLYTAASGTGTAATASAAQTLTFNNANTGAVTVALGGPSATAINSLGYGYSKGDLTITILPVSYTGQVLASAAATFGNTYYACDGSGIGARSVTLTKSGAIFTGTLTYAGTPGSGNLANYSFNCASTSWINSTGEFFAVTSMLDASGNPFTTNLPGQVGTGYRIDNLGPTTPALSFTNTLVRNNANWINDAFVFNALAANGGAISTASTEVVGAGGVGMPATAALTYAVTVGGNVVTSAAGLAESIDNVTYSATATAKDLLGNLSSASAAATFGVDRTPPTFTNALPADQSVLAAAPGATSTGAFTYTDPATLPAGPSQPTSTPIRLTVRKWTSATANKYSTGTAWQTAAAAYNVGLAGGMIDAVGTNDQGYYVVTAFAEDGAANASASVTRTYLYDITAPSVGAFAIPVLTASAGQSNLFSATATDNIDIASTQWAMTYPVATLYLPPTSFGAFQSWTKTATSSANYPLYRTMQYGAFAAPGSLTQVGQSVTDRASLSSGFVFQAIPAVNLPVAPTTSPFESFVYGGFNVANVTTPAAVDINGTSIATGNAESATIVATLTGPTNTALNPFVRVEFWIWNSTLSVYQLIGTAGAPTVVDNASNRVYTWTISWNPDAVGSYNNPNAVGAQWIRALGVNATNDALFSATYGVVNTTP